MAYRACFPCSSRSRHILDCVERARDILSGRVGIGWRTAKSPSLPGRRTRFWVAANQYSHCWVRLNRATARMWKPLTAYARVHFPRLLSRVRCVSTQNGSSRRPLLLRTFLHSTRYRRPLTSTAKSGLSVRHSKASMLPCASSSERYLFKYYSASCPFTFITAIRCR